MSPPGTTYNSGAVPHGPIRPPAGEEVQIYPRGEDLPPPPPPPPRAEEPPRSVEPPRPNATPDFRRLAPSPAHVPTHRPLRGGR